MEEEKSRSVLVLEFNVLSSRSPPHDNKEESAELLRPTFSFHQALNSLGK